MSSDPVAVVEAFVETMNALDWEGVYAALAEDVVVHNMPLEPLEGIAAVRAFYDGVAPAITSCDWRILHAQGEGNVVLTERIDDFTMAGKAVSLPVMGVFEIDADGRIGRWRDYFDLKSFEAQLGMPLPV